jgi:transposase
MIITPLLKYEETMTTKKRKAYSKQFKVDAVNLVVEQGRSAAEVSRNLDIGSGTLQRWVRESRDLQENAFPGNGRMSSEQEKIRKLETEVKRLKMEREILKKAAAFFAKESS